MKLKAGLFAMALLTALMIPFLSGCLWRFSGHPDIKNLPASPDSAILSDTINPTITVFIHGTRIFPKFYAQELFYSPDGFKHVLEIDKASHMHTIAEALAKADPTRFSYKRFYTFEWNGKLDFDERKAAAGELYTALKGLSDEYFKKECKRPRFRIITHSHGGNVALNLAAIAQEIGDQSFHVDELILLACPVQKETKDFVSAPLFGRIYSLSSRHDVLQIIDPQGLYKNNNNAPVFSERYFSPHPHLLQAQVKIYGRFLWHIEFLMKKCFARLPVIMDAMDSWYRQMGPACMVAQKVPIVDVHGKMVKIYPKPALR